MLMMNSLEKMFLKYSMLAINSKKQVFCTQISIGMIRAEILCWGSLHNTLKMIKRMPTIEKHRKDFLT